MSVIPQIDDAQDIFQAYEAMVKIYGQEVFAEKRRAVGCMLDIAPKLPEEARYLEIALSNHIPDKLREGNSRSDKRSIALKAIEDLGQKGIPVDNAVNILDAFCRIFHINISVIPDYSEGQEIPYEPVEGDSIQDEIDSLNHIRWFLNHQEDYNWNSGKEKLIELRKLMGNSRKNRSEIIQKYKEVVSGFHNNPYEEAFAICDSKENWKFTSNKFENYFVIINGIPVTVGFAKKYPGPEVDAACQRWRIKYDNLVASIERIRASRETYREKKEYLLKERNRFVLFALILISGLVWVTEKWLLNMNVRPALKVLRDAWSAIITNEAIVAMKAWPVWNDWSVFQKSMAQDYISCYFTMTNLTVAMLLGAALAIFSIIICCVRARKISRKYNEVLQTLPEEVLNNAKILLFDIEKYFSGALSGIRIPKTDYRDSLSQTNLDRLGSVKTIIPKAGLLGLIIMFCCAVMILVADKDIFSKAITGGECLQAILDGRRIYLENGEFVKDISETDFLIEDSTEELIHIDVAEAETYETIAEESMVSDFTEQEVIVEVKGGNEEKQDVIHHYEYFVDDCKWIDAYEKSKEKGGYLVRIDNREEYEYILSEIQKKGYEKIQFYLGGRRDRSSASYYWVDEKNTLFGEALNLNSSWSAEEWMQGEPSYRDGEVEEAYMNMYYYSEAGDWVWNDVPNDVLEVAPYYSGKIGYIVEYEDMQTVPSVDSNEKDAGNKMITTANVNMRSEPNASSKIVQVLSEGIVVDVAGKEGNWCKVIISVDGTEVNGFVSENFLAGYP